MLKKDIFKEGNLYIIRKEIDGELVDFGSFSSLEEAIDERDELEEYGWPFLKENPKNKFVEKRNFLFQPVIKANFRYKE